MLNRIYLYLRFLNICLISFFAMLIKINYHPQKKVLALELLIINLYFEYVGINLFSSRLGL